MKTNPTLSASTTSPIVVGESITLTPNIPDGTWTYDSDALQRDGYIFIGRVAGLYVITYTVEGQSVSFDLSVIQAPAPTSEATPTPPSSDIQDDDEQVIPITGENRGRMLTIMMLAGAILLTIGLYSTIATPIQRKRKTNK